MLGIRKSWQPSVPKQSRKHMGPLVVSATVVCVLICTEERESWRTFWPMPKKLKQQPSAVVCDAYSVINTELHSKPRKRDAGPMSVPSPRTSRSAVPYCPALYPQTVRLHAH